jgi:hypothetical protein
VDEFTVAGLLQLMAVPPDVNATVPVGPAGVKLTPLKVAVKVTRPLTLDAEEGEMVSVGASCATVWLIVAAVAEL